MTARDWKNSIGSDEGRHTETLAHQAYKKSGIRGPLNPAFGEEFMGYRIGWTELSASVTAWFLKQRGKRSQDLSESKTDGGKNEKV